MEGETLGDLRVVELDHRAVGPMSQEHPRLLECLPQRGDVERQPDRRGHIKSGTPDVGRVRVVAFVHCAARENVGTR